MSDPGATVGGVDHRDTLDLFRLAYFGIEQLEAAPAVPGPRLTG